ncbi:hypothetical protein [Isoalcanivorax indicus]|uniref:hypothetical protein n=1 Tax=Isoalcanivorax indicus TaxID=2202653 RepID=UPI000DBA929E|nr:hypothetical protein [Isoalcanivorax indicus]
MSSDNRFPPSDLPLLNELDDIRALLGDGLDIPLLEPETPPEPVRTAAPPRQPPATAPARTQPPLRQAPAQTVRPASADPVHQVLAERENPFLPRQTMERLAQHRAHTPDSLRPPPQSAATTRPAVPAQPSDSEVRAAVDEILAVWLPRIERELRDRLTRSLLGKDGL